MPSTATTDAALFAVVLYYKYVRLGEHAAEQLAREQEQLCASLALTGRVRVATEGINGTLGGTAEHVAQYVALMRAREPFHDVDWKLSTSLVPPFADLHVRVVAEIVAIELPDAQCDLAFGGTHLSPRAFHAALQPAQLREGQQQRNDIALIDVRNNYEYNIGHFRGALNPNTRRFGQFPAWVRAELPALAQKDKILMYCTGGVRCEKASAFLAHLGLRNVFQLEGGIHRFLEHFPDGGGVFEGKNFVFDQRVTIASDDTRVAGVCDKCAAPNDAVSGARCAYCRSHLLLCTSCHARWSVRADPLLAYCADHVHLVAGDADALARTALALERELAQVQGKAKKGKRRSLRKQLDTVARRIQELAATAPAHHRRGGRGGATQRRKAVVESDTRTTPLFAEWRAHEEACAACVIQRQTRAFLSRVFMAKLLTEVYEKQYDPIEKRYFYVNTVTNESTWEKPRVLTLFLAHDHDVAAKQVPLTPVEAAKRIQRCGRAFVALRSVKQLVRETYMKLFNKETQSFYYLNTKTGAVAQHKPAFLRDDEDLDIEQFHFRKAVVKLTTATNLYGSGIIGRFCGTLCVLSDGKTLPNEQAAQSAHAVCNYAASRIPFQVVLASEKFFAPIVLSARASGSGSGSGSGSTAADAPDFALCALDEAQFQVIAGTNIRPLQFELNDRKMGCADASQGRVHVHDPIEVVGHPYGKLQVLHARKLGKMVPNSISPSRFEYDTPTESGAAGSAVFTRGGKLLGVQPFVPLKVVPHECWHIKPILDAATQLVTPPEPFLLTSCVASQDVHVVWQISRWYKPLRGLDVHFELELCCHAEKSTLHHDQFVCVYTGKKRSRHVGRLQSDTLYSLRCRAVNAMRKGAWSSVMRVVTLPSPSMAWRLKHCTTLSEAIARMRQQGKQDQHLHLKSVQWIYARLQAARDEEAQNEQCEAELAHCDGLELLVDSLAWWFPDATANVLVTLHVLTHLTRFQQRTYRLAGSLPRMHQLCALLAASAPTRGQSTAQEELDGTLVPEKDADELRVPIALLAWLGRILEQNPSAKQVARVCGAVPLVLSFLDRDSFRHQGLIAAECCYLLGVYSYDNTAGRWEIVHANGLALLRDMLEAYFHDAKVLYWALVALGNVASGCDADQRRELDAATARLHLIDAVCACRTHFLTRVRELELDVVAARARLAQLQATHIGDEMRNAMDACTHEVETLDAVVAAANDHNVADAADYALRYVLTPAQRRVQHAATHIMRRVLHRKLAVAYFQWCDVTVYERQRAVVQRFLTTVTDRQRSAAFRRWERVVRHLRQHKTSVLQTLGSGLAIDLTKKRRERYRMLVLQK